MIWRMALPRLWHPRLAEVTALSSLVLLGGCGESPLAPEGSSLVEAQKPGTTFVITLEAADRCLTATEGMSQFAAPLTDELHAIAGVESAGSGASAGLAYASATFEPGTGAIKVLDEVEQAIARVRDRFPEGTQVTLYLSPFTDDPDQGMLPVQCLRGPGGPVIYYREPATP